VFKFVVAPSDPNPTIERLNLPGVDRATLRADPDAHQLGAEKIAKGIKEGFFTLPDAERWATALANEHPGVVFIIYEARSAIEVPRAPLQQKRFNAQGELVNA
jgi:hypothetical protein